MAAVIVTRDLAAQQLAIALRCLGGVVDGDLDLSQRSSMDRTLAQYA